MGVPLSSRNLAQVSMNLTDFEQTPIHRVFETVRAEAERSGVPVVGSEIVGLIPKKALEMAAERFLRMENFRPSVVLENRLAEAAPSGLNEFLEALAAPSATPGGGSASAAAGAMAAALGAMVAALAKRDGREFEADRKFLSDAVDRDSQAFNRVMAAYRIPKAERTPHVEEALHHAATVPMEVAERAFALDRRLAALQRETPARFSSDLETGRVLARAAVAGALANVRINLESITDEGFHRTFEERVAALS
jgi:formiminotetrahydrofolate cyclodeaminase